MNLRSGLHLKTFKEYFKENVEEGEWALNDLSGDVKSLIKKSQKYPTEKIPLSDLIALEKNGKAGTNLKLAYFTVNGKELEYDKLSNDLKAKYSKEENQRIENANLLYPIIVATDNNKLISILDGNHRYEKAKKYSVNELPAKLIPIEDLK